MEIGHSILSDTFTIHDITPEQLITLAEILGSVDGGGGWKKTIEEALDDYYIHLNEDAEHRAWLEARASIYGEKDV